MIVRLDSLDDFMRELLADAANKTVVDGIVRVQAEVSDGANECETNVWLRAAYLRGPEELVEAMLFAGLDYDGKTAAAKKAEDGCKKIKQACDDASLSCRRGRIEL